MIDSLLAAHPVDLYLACDEMFAGEAWLDWEPDTILLELQSDVSDAAVDKILAVQAVAANSSAVCKSAAAFEKVCNAFCNNICVMDVIQPPEVEELSYAVSQIELIIRKVHGEKTEIHYTDEVPSYVAAVAKFRGWFMLPRNLFFAQPMLNELLGQGVKTRIYRDHKHLLDVVSDLAASLDRKDAQAILDSPEIAELAADDMSSLLVRRLVGALLYDPTLPEKA